MDMHERKGKRMGRSWKREELDYLFKYYGKKSPQDIADHLGKKKHCILRMASKHGLRSGRYLSEWEKEYIDKSIGKYSYDHICKKLGRDYTALKSYCYKNYCNPIHDGKFFTMAEVGRLVGISRATIRQTWVLSHGLKARKVGKNVFIRPDNLYKFMQSNPDLWDATKCDRVHFRRFEWFEEKREKDFDKMVQNRWKDVI